MPDASKIVARIRALGANVLLDGDKLRIVNRAKLPTEAMEFIRQHGREIAAWLDAEGEFEERAAIMQHDGGLSRASAEYLAKLLLSSPPAGVDPADWEWFVEQATKIVDVTEEVQRAA